MDLCNLKPASNHIRSLIPARLAVSQVERINKKDIQTQLASDTAGREGKWDVNKSWHAQVPRYLSAQSQMTPPASASAAHPSDSAHAADRLLVCAMQYKDSAYVYVGGLPNGLSEGDVVVSASLALFSLASGHASTACPALVHACVRRSLAASAGGHVAVW